jgi:hypothetical protein
MCIKRVGYKNRFEKLTRKNGDELESTNQKLRERDTMNKDVTATLSDNLAQVMQEIEIMKKRVAWVYCNLVLEQIRNNETIFSLAD